MVNDQSGKEFETGLAHADEAVAEFEDTRKGFVGRLQHALHINPALVPLIVLVASIILFGMLIGQRFFHPLQ